MKKVFFIVVISFALNSCGFNLEKKCYNFDNFKGTALWELAQAVREDNATEVKELLKNKGVIIDFKDPKYNQTLLALAVQNKKPKAFIALLNAGANANALVGNPKDATPFIYGIQTSRGCDFFYVKGMLRHGANPNLEIKNPNPGHVFFNSFPLLVAIGIQTNPNLDLIKLLVNNGANTNCCYQQPYSDFCEGVISKSLLLNDMESLKYFIIEKKITIPDTVFIRGELNKSSQEAFGLKAILTSKYYTYQDFERDGQKIDRSELRKTRDEIIAFLNKKLIKN
jgi:hypothetical protein